MLSLKVPHFVVIGDCHLHFQPRWLRICRMSSGIRGLCNSRGQLIYLKTDFADNPKMLGKGRVGVFLEGGSEVHPKSDVRESVLGTD